WLRDQRTDWNQVEPNHDAEADEGLYKRQSSKCNDRGADGAKADAHRETEGKCVSLIGSRREQEDHDGRKRDGESAIRPCGNDPEKLSRADHRERPPGVDESRPPIGHVEPCAPARTGTIRLSGQQRDCIESMDQADQHPGGLIGEQPQTMACLPALRSACEPPRRRAVACRPGRPSKVTARPDWGPTAAAAEYCAARHPPLPEPRDLAIA